MYSRFIAVKSLNLVMNDVTSMIDVKKQETRSTFYQLSQQLQPSDTTSSFSSFLFHSLSARDDSRHQRRAKYDKTRQIIWDNNQEMGRIGVIVVADVETWNINNYCCRGDQWLSFDNVRSIRVKSEYAFDQGLAGVMTWSIDTDDFLGVCNGPKFPLLRWVLWYLIITS